jgi:hypothetical protein
MMLAIAVVLGMAWVGVGVLGWAMCAIGKKCDEALEDVEFYRPPPRRVSAPTTGALARM